MHLDLLLDLQTENMSVTLNSWRAGRMAQLMKDIEAEWSAVINSAHEPSQPVGVHRETAHTEK